MNNKGWGLQAMLILSSILILALLISTFITKSKFPSLLNDSDGDYESQYSLYLERLEEKSKLYASSNYPTRGNNLIVITYSTLYNENYIETLIDPNTNQECNGYILVRGNDFRPYLKCGLSYKTSGYNFLNE